MSYGRITCKRLWIHVNMIECEWVYNVWMFNWMDVVMLSIGRILWRMWFWNFMFYKMIVDWLIMMVINYVDEFLHAIDDDFDGVCMYWKLLMIVDDLLLNICINWVICSCIHDVGVELYIHIGDDQILYHIGDDKYLVFILTMTMMRMYLRWRPWGDRYHMHIEVVFRRIA